ncbi:MAG: hypothetical protein WDA16_08430 [Candidatus Thermoplasmatota archaeon]
MGQLAERIAELMRGYGLDPAARQGELQAFASIERSDPKAAQERFHEWKRALAAQRRSALLTQLRAFDLVGGLPTHDTRGWPLKEIESDIRELTRSLGHARDIAAAIMEEREARGRLRERALATEAPLAAVTLDALRALAEEAERRRRAALREASVEVRVAAARRRAAKLALPVDVPPTAHLSADQANATLATVERKLSDIESLVEAHDAVVAPLRDRAVRAWRASSEKALLHEAQALLDARDVAGLRALAPRATTLREEAAREASKAARARKSGKAPPERERGVGDTMDGYG